MEAWEYMVFFLFVFSVLFHHFYAGLNASWAVLFRSRVNCMRQIERASVRTADLLFASGRRLLGLRVINEQTDIDLPSQCIIVANHQSLLDIYMNLLSFPGQRLRFVAKAELTRYIPGVSKVLRFGRHCLISRDTQLRKTNDGLRTFAKRCIREKFSPCIFPEGTRSRDGVLREFNSGAYRILQRQLRLPTLVLAVEGGWKFSHLTDFFRKKEYIYRVKILALLPAPQNKRDTLASLEESHRLIETQISQWRDEEDRNAEAL